MVDLPIGLFERSEYPPFFSIQYSFFIAARKRCLYGDVKVSTGTANPDKRVAVRRRYKSLNFKINDKNTVALAA